MNILARNMRNVNFFQLGFDHTESLREMYMIVAINFAHCLIIDLKGIMFTPPPLHPRLKRAHFLLAIGGVQRAAG